MIRAPHAGVFPYASYVVIFHIITTHLNFNEPLAV